MAASKSRSNKKREPSRLSAAAASRAARLVFDSAQTTDENTRHWANADQLGPVSALDPGVRRTLRSRARYEVANDTYAAGMISTLANDTIGTGPMLQLMSRDKAADSQVEREFWRWSQSIRLPQKLRTMRRAKAADGEAFGSLFTNPQLPNPVKLDLQLHEAEMISSPTWGIDSDTLNDGVILDDFGNVTAYVLLSDHPGERMGGSRLDFEYVRAQDMLHMFNADRPAQIRGCPEIAPALPLYAMRRRYALATIRAAEIAAMLSWLLKTQDSPTDPVDLVPLDSVDMERGMGMTLPAGWEPFQLKAEQPTVAYEQFTKAIIREIARCLNMPFAVAAGDSSDYNYASGRMDYQIYFKAIDVERSYWELNALDVVFAKWWQEARLVRGLLPETLRGREVPEHSWRWDGREHVDPLKEANAQAVRLAAHTTTLADEYAKQGHDWEEKLRQRAKELSLMAELGLSVDASENSSGGDDEDE